LGARTVRKATANTRRKNKIEFEFFVSSFIDILRFLVFAGRFFTTDAPEAHGEQEEQNKDGQSVAGRQLI